VKHERRDCQHADGGGEGDDHRLPDRQTARGDVLKVRATRPRRAGLRGVRLCRVHGPAGESTSAGTGRAGRAAVPGLREGPARPAACLPCLRQGQEAGGRQAAETATTGPCPTVSEGGVSMPGLMGDRRSYAPVGRVEARPGGAGAAGGPRRTQRAGATGRNMAPSTAGPAPRRRRHIVAASGKTRRGNRATEGLRGSELAALHATRARDFFPHWRASRRAARAGTFRLLRSVRK